MADATHNRAPAKPKPARTSEQEFGLAHEKRERTRNGDWLGQTLKPSSDDDSSLTKLIYSMRVILSEAKNPERGSPAFVPMDSSLRSE